MTQDRQTELDTEEQRAAALYRSLPAGEPSPALDARIRAQAHAAVRPKRPVWLWGAGVAASAVLAVGLFWRMGLPDMQQRGPTVSNHMASRPARDDTAVLDSADLATPLPPPPMPAEARRQVGATTPVSSASVMNEQDEALDAAKPASPSGQLSANRAARERAAAPAVVPSTPAEKQEGFAGSRAAAGNEAKAGAAAGEVLPQKRAEAATSQESSMEELERGTTQSRNPEPEFRPPLKLPKESAPPSPEVEDRQPPPIPVEEPAPMALEAPPPAPPAPPAPPVERPAQAAPVAAAPKAMPPRKEVGEHDAERRQLDKTKDDVLGAIDVSGNNVSPIDVSSVESSDVLAEMSTKNGAAVAKAIAELPRRFRRDVSKNAKLYPESWLSRVEALLANDKREEAVANLRVFHVAYPTHTLPDTLAVLADEEGIVSDDGARDDPAQ
ncbi:MAG: hypothetical protein KDI75_00545 [Xanthomonadales bacterium]|nr:hypothetical protein [Xanthomonadales bacterium]